MGTPAKEAAKEVVGADLVGCRWLLVGWKNKKEIMKREKEECIYKGDGDYYKFAMHINELRFSFKLASRLGQTEPRVWPKEPDAELSSASKKNASFAFVRGERKS